MTTPTLPEIQRHYEAFGGLWLVIPARTEAGQPRPFFVRLGVSIGRKGDVATCEGGDLAATINENKNMQGAEWCPVNSRGERV